MVGMPNSLRKVSVLRRSRGANWCRGALPPVDLRAVCFVRAICNKRFDYPVRTYFKLIQFLSKGDNQFIRGGMHDMIEMHKQGMHDMNEMHKQYNVCIFLMFSQTYEINNI
jgi:hypothetical protein